EPEVPRAQHSQRARLALQLDWPGRREILISPGLERPQKPRPWPGLFLCNTQQPATIAACRLFGGQYPTSAGANPMSLWTKGGHRDCRFFFPCENVTDR